ncbi:disease resistance protein RGA2-like [Pyrus ussuriensis x Pyrus communis]|uniref:Disease resistance protein RGA2-like n=1 Tax=Pyrus ussuriensis x Pyrus communis TaxID=2448454 RepID=A0A5N5GBZ9_9ROSA|nr:disease resistance protein RGA2-like [Pyrus ussuriensis x Pyrus communis]
MVELVFMLASRIIAKLSFIASEEICLLWGVKVDLQKLGHTMSTIRDMFWMPKRSKHVTRSYADGYDNLKMCSLMRMICWTSLSAKLFEGKWFVAVA